MPARKPTAAPAPSPWEELQVRIAGGLFDENLMDIAALVGERLAKSGRDVVWRIESPVFTFHQDDLTLDMLEDIKAATGCPALLVTPDTFVLQPAVLRALIGSVFHRRDHVPEDQALERAGAVKLRQVMRGVVVEPVDPQMGTAPS